MRVPGIRFVQGRNRYGISTKYGIAIHATANTASAANEAAYATRRTDGTSSHFYADNVEVIQSLDTNDRAGHAGSTQGNTYAISVEFTGLNSWSRAKWLSSVAWERVGAVLAAVSRAHNIPATRATVAQMKTNPQVRGAYDHNQMRLAWGGTDHTDPGSNFPWDHLLAVWQRHLSPEDDMGLDDTRPLYKGGPTERDAVGDLHFAAFKGNPAVAVEQQALARIELAQKAILTAVSGVNEESVLAAVREESQRMQNALAAHSAAEAERDTANVATLLDRFGELADPITGTELRAALRDVYGDAFDRATDATAQG